MMDAAIYTENLVKTYHPGTSKEVRALDGLSFAVPKGKIFGLLGPNGAGKTTLIKVLSTLTRATSGTARVMGHDVDADPLRVRQQICVVLQQTAVESFLSVEDNLATYGRFQRLSRAEIAARSRRLMERFGLESERKQKAIDLSGGYKRRLQVAKVFMNDAPVVFLDEATTGMDPITKRATLDAIAAEADRGRTIILTTHLLDEAEKLCHSLLFIDHGHAVLEGELAAIKARVSQVFDVSVAFDTLDAERRARISRIPAIRRAFDGTSAALAIDARSVTPQELVAALAEIGSLTRIEIRGATLEDIYLQVLGPGPDRSAGARDA